MKTRQLIGWGSAAVILMGCALAGLGADSATKPAGKVTVVAKGSLTPTLEGEGVFEAVDGFEVRIRPKAYAGELVVTTAAENGAVVKKGDSLLVLDKAPIEREMAAATNELVLAKANAQKAEDDLKLGEAADKLAMEAAERELSVAQANLKWWDEVDAPGALKTAELSLKEFKDSIDDQVDELDQLKKMYKSEELTNATADIVVKRAVRRLDRSKEQLPAVEGASRKPKELSNPQMRELAVAAVAKASLGVEQAKSVQAQAKVARQSAAVTARLAVEKADLKIRELKTDSDGMTVAAPFDGVVYYGSQAAGVWQNNSPKLLKAMEKVAPQTVVMTLVSPGKLRVVMAAPEAKLPAARLGGKAEVTPRLLSGVKYTGTISAIARTSGARGGANGFDVTIDLANVDPALCPGMTAGVKIIGDKVDGLVLVPNSAINSGKVTVRSKEDKEEEREVTVGRTDGKMTEVLKGLEEGERVVEK